MSEKWSPIRLEIDEERILQISNNISEEYADLGEVDFASRAELCEVVHYFRHNLDNLFANEQLKKMDELLDGLKKLAQKNRKAKP